MLKKPSTLRGMFALTLASSLFALSCGCSNHSGMGASSTMSTPLLIPNNDQAVTSSTPSGSQTSVNNTRDLAAAQSDDVLSHAGTARDLDSGGGSPPLTYTSLGDALRQIGLTPEDDKTTYVLKVKTTTQDQLQWTFPINVSLSDDQSVIWITCALSQVDQNGTPSSQSLIDVLAANQQLGLSFFVLDSKHFLILQRPMANAGLSSQKIGTNLKAFFDCLKASEPLWNKFFKPSSADNSGGGGNNPFGQ